MKKTKKGFTLIEALIGISIASTGTILYLQMESDETKKKQTLNFANEAKSIINAIDYRFTVDGYSPNNWANDNWANEKEIVEKLIKEDLTSKYLTTCNNGKWEPSSIAERSSKIIKCDLWKERNGLKLDMEANLEKDSVGYIQSFDLYFSFKDSQEFKSNYMDLKYSLSKVFSDNSKDVSGRHYYSYVQKSNKKKEISGSDCLKSPMNCSIKIGINRSGGREYVRMDGSNSMLNSHLSFVKTEDTSPLKCIKWSNSDADLTGSWTQSAEDCGVGIYNEPTLVEINADNGTFKNVVLDKNCIVYEWNGTEVIDSGKLSPCGFTSNSSDPNNTEIYQVLENTISNKALIENTYVKKANAESIDIKTLNVNILDVDNLVTPLINTDVLEVSKILNFDNIATFKEAVTIKQESTFKDVVVFNKSVNLKNELNLNHLLSVSGDSNVLNLMGGNEIKTKNADLNSVDFISDLAVANLNIDNKIEVKVDGKTEFKKDLTSSKNIEASEINSDFTSISSTSSTTHGVMSESAFAGSKMKAPIGNFNNIDSEIARLEYELARLENAVNSNAGGGGAPPILPPVTTPPSNLGTWHGKSSSSSYHGICETPAPTGSCIIGSKTTSHWTQYGGGAPTCYKKYWECK